MESSGYSVSKLFWFLLLVMCIFFGLFITAGFYMFYLKNNRVVTNESGGNIILKYSGDYNGIIINNSSKMDDTNGIISDYYIDFSVDVKLLNAKYIDYEIVLSKDSSFLNISDNDIRIYLEQEQNGKYVEVLSPTSYKPLNKKTKYGSKIGSMILYKDHIKSSINRNYRLRVWVSPETLLDNDYYLNISVNGKAY